MRFVLAFLLLTCGHLGFGQIVYHGYAPEGYGRQLVFIGSEGDEGTKAVESLAQIMAVRHGFKCVIYDDLAMPGRILNTADLLVLSGTMTDAEDFPRDGRPVVVLSKTGMDVLDDAAAGEKSDYRVEGGRKGRVFKSELKPDAFEKIANGIFWCLDMAIPAETDVTSVTDPELKEFQQLRAKRDDVDPGFEFANHPVNQYRTYHWYRNQAAEALKLRDRPDSLPNYPDIDGGVQGHWGMFHKNSYRDRRYNLAEHGPAVAGIFRSGKQTLPRAIAVRLSDDLSSAFDTETLSYSHVWKGDFLKFPGNRWGIGGGISPDSEQVSVGTAFPEGKGLPLFLGYYHTVKGITFSYEEAGKTYYDTPLIDKAGKLKRNVSLERGDISPAKYADKSITLSGKIGKQIPGSPFTIDRIPVPLHNEFGSVMLLGGVDFFANGDAAVCTMMGDVWRVSGLDETLEKVTWTRIATGLNQALGLSIFDDKIYVVGRDRITRLHDLNADGEMDFYENFCGGYPASPGGHDFYVGLQRDSAGYFYFVAANSGVIKVSPDGRSFSVMADGFRNANGIGVRGDGLVVASTNEGDWTPASAVMEIRQGDFYGRKAMKDGKPIAPAMVYLPRGIDNSSGGQIFCTSEKWGPMKDQLIHFSWGNGTWMTILRDEKSGERTQGAVVPLPGDFESGAHRARFNPKDGQLYVVGSDGWGNYAITDGSFDRIRYNPESENLYPAGWQAKADGIEFTFATPLDPESVKASNFFCQTWNYTYGEHYGSLEFSVKNPEVPGHDTVPISEVRLSDDGKTLFLEMPNLVPAMQFHVYGELKSASGADFRLNVFPTILRLEADSGNTTKRLNLPIRWPVKFVPKVPNGTRGRQLKIEAISGLRFSEKELKAKAGEQITIRFQNMDSIPHNFVLCKPGTLETVGMASSMMLANPKIAEMHYVPETDDVLHFSPMLYTRSGYEMNITAPAEPGIYPYMCTFPGHWAVMKGTLIIE